jgi:hypothetical protein
MTYLPTGSNVTVYPDGVVRSRPKDGERFVHDNEVYVWDDVIGEWTDYKGRIVKFKQKDPVLSMYDDWTQLSLPNLDDEEEEEKEKPSDYYKKSSSEDKKPKEGDKLKGFFFPKNTSGCECGAWATGSDRHSEYCRLYKKEK